VRIAPRHVYVGCAVAAVAAGIVVAALRAWICDDAYITYRYAEHLVGGDGLVFNAGERVEGYTNLSWTVWTALGMLLGVSPEAWTSVWGIACHGLTLSLLAWRGWRISTAAGAAAWPLPVAAMLGAAHVDLASFATGGLETGAFTLLAFAGYLLVSPEGPATGDRRRLVRLAAGGALLALASLTRPDGVLFAAVCGVWIAAGRDVRGAVAFGAGFLLLWLPVTAWRIDYYGDLFPNTYYAKSAALSWWSQGWLYTRLYFARYWPLLVALPLALFARPRRSAVLELSLAAVYAAYVARVGGDFMFARLLLPTTPFLLLLLQRGLVAVSGARPLVHAGAAAALLAAMALTPSPVRGKHRPGGIADEHATYTRHLAGWAERADRNGARLAAMFEGLPVRVGFFGAQARLVYRSRVATAIECETGLTDATIARQTLERRGRIGHEKHAKLPYLLERRVHLVLARGWANKLLDLDRSLPDVPAMLGEVQARLLTWDPAIVAALRARGATIPDVPAQIDRVIARMDRSSPEAVLRDWERYRLLYFDHVDDPRREAPFRARLGLEPAR
jgi:hypothetical protein